MNKKIFAAVLAVCMMVCLCACNGGGNGGAAQQPETTTTTTEATTTTTTGSAIPTPGEGQVLYSVKVVNSKGEPVANEYVQMCLETCVFQPTNAEGIAYFTCAEADYKVTVMSDPAATEYHFESGSHEMTITYDPAAAEPNTNDVTLAW
ncbi:MAG: hypothetical protein IIX28_01240 [Clostridia bacterium]|nr:hypothetical protein [Clostridia bacterium]